MLNGGIIIDAAIKTANKKVEPDVGFNTDWILAYMGVWVLLYFYFFTVSLTNVFHSSLFSQSHIDYWSIL